jgi:hypothetical protein
MKRSAVQPRRLAQTPAPGHRDVHEPTTSATGGFTRRGFLLAGAAALAACSGLPVAPSRPALRLIGEASLPHGLNFQGTTVGGLSGLDYDSASDTWYLLSDDRSDINPARFYTARIALTGQRLDTPVLLSSVTLQQPDGKPWPSRRLGGRAVDPESIRWRAQTRSLLWSSEGDARLGLDPAVREIRPDGSPLRELTLPVMFTMQADKRSGPRDNLSFEGLSLTPDGRQAWVAMENALWQDGPMPTPEAPGGPCRFTLFDLASGQAVRQIAYVPDAIPQAPKTAGAYADNGISEILMLDAQRMLVLERAYISGIGNSLRLYLIDTGRASDTLGTPRLLAGQYTPAVKTLLADFDAFVRPGSGAPGISRLDNTEGMAWGPRLPGGSRSLVFVSDDNFNPAQVTQFLAFEFTDPQP